MLHFLVLGCSFAVALLVYVLVSRPSTTKWELVRHLAAGKLGLYKHRHYTKFGKFERTFTTYAILKSATPGKVWNFVWEVGHIERKGRAIGPVPSLDFSQQAHLHEIGFAPPLGLYLVYTGEEDHLRYPEREKYLLELHKKTLSSHSEWRNDPSFGIRRSLARWQLAIGAFVLVAGVGAWLVPVDVEAPQVLAWTMVGMVFTGLLVGVQCLLMSRGSAMAIRASLGAFVAACLIGGVSFPPVLFGLNSLSFQTVCEGSVPVERFWNATEEGAVVHRADITLPPSCEFNAHHAKVSPQLYEEFQNGRSVVDVVVSRGLLGYKRLALIGT